VLPGQQIRAERRDPRPVAGRGGRLDRERRGPHDTAATRPPLRLVLDHRQLDRGQVEDLPPLPADHRGVVQTLAAATANLRDMDPDLIRIRALHQPEPRTTMLLTGLTTRPDFRRS